VNDFQIAKHRRHRAPAARQAGPALCWLGQLYLVYVRCQQAAGGFFYRRDTEARRGQKAESRMQKRPEGGRRRAERSSGTPSRARQEAEGNGKMQTASEKWPAGACVLRPSICHLQLPCATRFAVQVAAAQRAWRDFLKGGLANE
jgi:hypothetical protein